MVRLEIDRGLLPIGKVGLSLSFAFPDYFAYLELRAHWYDGSKYLYAAVQINDVTDDIDVYKKTAGYTKVDNWKALYRNPGDWSTYKVVIDFTNGFYDSLRLNANEYDLSAWELATWASSTAPRLAILMQLTARDGQIDSAYVDDFFVTFGEP